MEFARPAVGQREPVSGAGERRGSARRQGLEPEAGAGEWRGSGRRRGRSREPVPGAGSRGEAGGGRRGLAAGGRADVGQVIEVVIADFKKRGLDVGGGDFRHLAAQRAARASLNSTANDQPESPGKQT